jgi:hypothetical protein
MQTDTQLLVIDRTAISSFMLGHRRGTVRGGCSDVLCVGEWGGDIRGLKSLSRVKNLSR